MQAHSALLQYRFENVSELELEHNQGCILSVKVILPGNIIYNEFDIFLDKDNPYNKLLIKFPEVLSGRVQLTPLKEIPFTLPNMSEKRTLTEGKKGFYSLQITTSGSNWRPYKFWINFSSTLLEVPSNIILSNIIYKDSINLEVLTKTKNGFQIQYQARGGWDPELSFEWEVV